MWCHHWHVQKWDRQNYQSRDCCSYWKYPGAATVKATKLFCNWLLNFWVVECVDDLPTAALGIHTTVLRIYLTHSPLVSHWLSALQSSSGILFRELAELAGRTLCLTAVGDIERLWRFPWGFPQITIFNRIFHHNFVSPFRKYTI